jgi:hypothetical protein
MTVSHQKRLARLEQASDGPPQVFVLWAPDVHDIEAERQRLRDERGMRATDTLLLVRWMRAGEMQVPSGV